MEKMSNDQLRELLKIGDVKGFNEYRQENPDQEIDLQEADLQEAELKGVNLKGVNLRDANFEEANLEDANFFGANLFLANFRGANLQGANLGDTDARKANFSWSILAKADMQLMKICSNQKNAIILSLGILEDENE